MLSTDFSENLLILQFQGDTSKSILRAALFITLQLHLNTDFSIKRQHSHTDSVTRYFLSKLNYQIEVCKLYIEKFWRFGEVTKFLLQIFVWFFIFVTSIKFAPISNKRRLSSLGKGKISMFYRGFLDKFRISD